MRRAPAAPEQSFDARLTIDSIAAGGDGVARHEGLVVFVPRSAPGDVVRASVSLRAGARFGRGRVLEVVEASPLRVDPPCAHYVVDRCGGCQVQHLAYDAQLDVKAGIVRDGLQRIGGRVVESPRVRASERPWRYRRKLTLAMRRRGATLVAGLHPYDAPGAVFDMADCPITDERVLAVWREIRAAAALLPDVPRLRGAVRLLDERGASFVLEGGTRWPRARKFFAAVPSLLALWWEPEDAARRQVATRAPSAEPTTGFVQVNPGTAAALAAEVVARVQARAPRRVVDAYAGAGDVALALALAGAQVTAIELDAAQTAWSASRLPAGSRAVAGRTEELLPAALPADVVILNPPRAGVDARVTEALLASPPRAIVYVSCNPATLARDVGRLPGWRVAHVEAFDMFPQTAHVETLCELVPEVG